MSNYSWDSFGRERNWSVPPLWCDGEGVCPDTKAQTLRPSSRLRTTPHPATSPPVPRARRPLTMATRRRWPGGPHFAPGKGSVGSQTPALCSFLWIIFDDVCFAEWARIDPKPAPESPINCGRRIFISTVNLTHIGNDSKSQPTKADCLSVCLFVRLTGINSTAPSIYIIESDDRLTCVQANLLVNLTHPPEKKMSLLKYIKAFLMGKQILPPRVFESTFKIRSDMSANQCISGRKSVKGEKNIHN